MASNVARVFALHGWGRLPVDLYWPGLIASLETSGATVVPNTLICADGEIQTHIDNLAKVVGQPDENTYFIGQSVGNQVIARYLASLPETAKVGGWVAIGGWFTLDKSSSKPRPEWLQPFLDSCWDKLSPWCDVTTTNTDRLKHVCPRVLALLGVDDPFRGLDTDGQANKEDFEKYVNAKVLLLPGRGHFILEALPEEDITEIKNFVFHK